MNDHQTVRISFSCANCGSVNELTVAHIHEATVIHCSRCSTPVAPLRLLLEKPAHVLPTELIPA